MMGKTFKYSSHVYVGDVEAEMNIDFDEALDAIGVDYVTEWLEYVTGLQLGNDPSSYDLSDPVVRLEIITALRNEGYVVESA